MSHLTDDERQAIIALLQQGAELPLDYRDLLFPPNHRDCKLTYAGKTPESLILAEAAPGALRQIRIFGDEHAKWQNALIFGDNAYALHQLLLWKQQGRLVNVDGSSGLKLVYIDPPFATRQEFLGSQQERAYQDRVAGAKFVESLRRRLILIKALLADDGLLCVHLDFRKKHYIRVILDEIFGEENFRNEIAVCRVKKSIRERERVRKLNEEFDTILLYASSEAATLLPPTRRVMRAARWHAFDAAGTRAGMDYDLFGHAPPPGRHWMYSRERAERMVADGTLRPHPRSGRPEYLISASENDLCNNLWSDISAGAFTAGYPTEKSEPLLWRVLEMTTQPGDLVLDAFAGSGTTLAVAEKLGRRWIGIDCGKLAIATIQRRLLQLRSGIGNKGRRISPRPFALYTIAADQARSAQPGSWRVWRRQALALFGCRDERHAIAGVQFDGYKDGASALVFDARRQGALNYHAIDSLHERVGPMLADRCWIIAPAAAVEFLEDCVERDGTRYLILRVPASLVAALAGRGRKTVRVAQIDRIIARSGFDLMRPPQVVCEYALRQRPAHPLKKDALITIKSFVSAAPSRSIRHKGDRETLALVLIDYDYPADRKASESAPSFTVDAAITAAEIEAAGWEIRLPYEALGAAIMVIYVDTSGNEYSEIVRLVDFQQPHAALAAEPAAEPA